MAESVQPATSGTNQASNPDRALDNVAVERCVRAWSRAHKKKLDEGEDDYEAERAANEAYLSAMPPLAGRDNIRNFVACVAEAAILKVLRQRDITQLLYAAQVAIGAAEREPNLLKPPAAAATPTPPIPPGGIKNRVSAG
jgi:hypothetical protein